MLRGPRVAVAVTLAMVLAMAGLLAPSGSAAPPTSRLFSSVNVLFSSPMHPYDAARMARGGIRTARLSFDWWGVEGTPTIYNWHKLDRWVGNLASQGVTTIPVLYGAPLWAVTESIPSGSPSRAKSPRMVPYTSPGGNATAYPPVKTDGEISRWQAFVEGAVARYGPGGTYWSSAYKVIHPGATPHPIRTWQVWNEPNIPGAFWPKPNVELYGKLVRITADAVHAVDPAARIALAGVPGRVNYHGVTYLKNLYRRNPDIRRYFDVVAFHPYAQGIGGVVNQLERVRRTMREEGDGAKPLWVSEIGWGSKRYDPSQYNFGRPGQAKMLTALFTALSRDRQRLHLSRVTWFDWRDSLKNVSAPCPWCDHAGLIDKRDHRKPAWDAYRRFVGS
jgi:hypothetical protein